MPVWGPVLLGSLKLGQGVKVGISTMKIQCTKSRIAGICYSDFRGGSRISAKGVHMYRGGGGFALLILFHFHRIFKNWGFRGFERTP